MKIKLCVIGYPIGHSLSPLIHTTLLDYLNLDYEYEKKEVKCEELSAFINYVKETGISGFNVTMPHKQTIMEYLDEIDEEAKLFHSVNTVKIENGKLYGYNTDAEGFRMSLPKCGDEIKGAKVVIIGAGGAASTVALKAATLGAKSIDIVNKRLETAEKILKILNEKSYSSAKATLFTYENLENACKNADIVINATPLGMSGIEDNFESFEFLKNTSKDATIYDLIYNPYETEFIKAAKAYGRKAVNGLGMLICQGLIADKIYLDCDFDILKVQKIIEDKYNK